MPRKSALWAATHRCYDLFTGKYHCECGAISNSVKEHNAHVVESHLDDVDLICRSVSWKTWDKLKAKYGWTDPIDDDIESRG